jgi:acyl-CoA synthetase (AMP-forming)/AMP-acid ligase II
VELNWDNLSDAIFHYAKIHPNSLAVVEAPKSLTYEELASLVGSTCLYLQELGIKEDDRVGIILNNHTDHVILAFALMRIGATAIEIYAEAPVEVHNELIQNLKLAAVFVESDSPTNKNCPIFIHMGLHWRDRIQQRSGDLRSNKKAEDNRLVMLTSGTSGKPKSIVSTHRQRMERVRSHAALLQDRWSPLKPGNALIFNNISFAGPHQFFINQIQFGGPIHILPKYALTNQFMRVLGSYDNAVCFVVANMCRAFLGNIGTEKPLFPNIQALISGGQPLMPAEKRAVLEYITPNFYESYGASGFGLISGLRPQEIGSKAESVGLPVADVEIVNSLGEKVPVNSIGHIRCRGLSKSEGFFNAPELTASPTELFRDDWYYPGDMASFDSDGYIHLKGRESDLIRHHGIEIHPFEIETIIMTLPLLKEAIVVGIPIDNDESRSYPVVVFVANKGFSVETLIAHCNEKLPPDKRPKYYITADYIKKFPSGKTDRTSIQAFAFKRLKDNGLLNK